MINVYKIRKWGALLMQGLIPSIFFYIGIITVGFLWGIAFLLAGVLITMLIAHFMLKNPFYSMVEGSGLLVINLDSTGILRPYIMGVDSPYIRGKVNRKPISDVFDRSTVFNMSPPKKLKQKALFKPKGGLKLDLSEDDYNKGRFALFHYPVLIWNDQIKSLITKDWLSNLEKDMFAEHSVIYLNRKMEELTSVVRDFGRAVVELLKPGKGLLGNKWVWIIIAIALGIMALLFAPAIIEQFSQPIQTAAEGLNTAQSAVTKVTP